MQAIIDDTHTQQSHPKPQSGQFIITVELAAILFLVGVSLLLRFMALGEVPITEAESRQALAAWRSVMPGVPGEPLLSERPLVFWGQALAFGLLGGSELSARLVTAFAGVLLSLSPLLFRGLLGSARAYLLALLLTFSPVLLAASRFSDGMVWAMLFAVVGIWAVWRFWETESKPAYGLLAMLCLGGAAFLSAPEGVLLLLILLVTAVVTLYLMALSAPDESDQPGDDFLVRVMQRFRAWPWLPGLGLMALIVVAASTGFLLNTGGLSMVAGVLGGFMGGFLRAPEGQPVFFPLLVSLFYETWLWVLALAAIVMMIRRGVIRFVEMFLLVWVVVAGFASLVYQGAGAAAALWLIVPLAGLATYIVTDALQINAPDVMWLGGFLPDDEMRSTTMHQGKWLIGLLFFALLVMAALHFQVLSRGILNVPNGSLVEVFSRFSEVGFANVARSMVWFLISVLFIIIGYFLAASIWGDLTTVRGTAIGLFAFIIMSGLSTGWNISVAKADDPTELWHRQATSYDATLLRQSLLELSSRHTRGFPVLEVAVVAPDDGVIAWELRDFTRAVFVEDISLARTAEVIIAPESAEPPDLGGSYVGQSFVLSREWSMNFMQGLDFLAWWSVRQARFQPVATQRVVLWVRQDIFDGRPVSTSLPR